jgi:hypothetical protein
MLDSHVTRNKPYRIAELMELWNLSRDSVIRIVDRHSGTRYIKGRKNKTRLVPPEVEQDIWNNRLRSRG